MTGSLAPMTVARLLQDSSPWLSCDDCFTLMDPYAESHVFGVSSPGIAMDVHLLSCHSCAEEAESLVELLEADQRLDEGVRFR